MPFLWNFTVECSSSLDAQLGNFIISPPFAEPSLYETVVSAPACSALVFHKALFENERSHQHPRRPGRYSNWKCLLVRLLVQNLGCRSHFFIALQFPPATAGQNRCRVGLRDKRA